MLNYCNRKLQVNLFLLAGILALSFFLAVGTSASAEETSPWLDADEVTDKRMEEQRDNYLQEMGWKLGPSKKNPNNAYLGWGYSDIKAKPGDIRYGQSRILAFEDAYAEAKGNFVLNRQREIITETISDFMLDELPEPDTPTENWSEYMYERASTALEKAFDLGEAQLDELLREFNIDPDKYHEAEKVEREEILRDNISIFATARAVESVSGLVIEKTFEDNDGIGVLVRHSHKTENIARQIASQEPVKLGTGYDPRISIEDHLETLTDEKAPFVYGVRVMKNRKGENVLVAFGQWSPAVTKTTNESLAKARIESAKKMARSRAEAALADFVNSTVVYETIGEAVEEEQIYNEITEGREQQPETYRIGDYLENVVKQYGEVKLEGITSVDTWMTNHVQTGHLLVGHIIKWSPSTRDAARGDFEEEEVIEEETDEEEDEGEIIESPF